MRFVSLPTVWPQALKALKTTIGVASQIAHLIRPRLMNFGDNR
jgi:hypothetical protein